MGFTLIYLHVCPEKNLSAILIQSHPVAQKFKNDPYTTTLGGFSKVTNYIFDAFRGPDMALRQRPAEEVADLISEAIPGLEVNQQEEPGFEVITRVSLPMHTRWQYGGSVRHVINGAYHSVSVTEYISMWKCKRLVNLCSAPPLNVQVPHFTHLREHLKGASMGRKAAFNYKAN